jgi:tetratricopeptide (TPR) repeat protein
VAHKNFDKGQQSEQNPQQDAHVQQILAQYRSIAQDIHKSRNADQVIDALTPITDLAETGQIALLKAISKENTTAAADVVLAINTYAPLKEVRKEARRSLLRLESNNVYAEWELPPIVSLADALGVDAFADFDEDEEDEDEGETVVDQFLSSWSEGDFETAYDLLATTSPLRQNLSRDEWVARRTSWAAEAKPARSQIDVGYGLEAELEDLDDLDESAEELDAFWSLELQEVASSSDIPELPTATITYAGTGRHWFWAGYTFFQEDDEFRIYSVRDKGGDALQLPVETLRQRIQEIADEITAMSELLDDDDDDDYEEDDDEEVVESKARIVVSEQEDDDDDEEDDELPAVDVEEFSWFSKQSMHYCDALIAQQPHDETPYALASQQATSLHEIERALAYSALVAERFPELRADALRSVGLLATHIATDEGEQANFEDEAEDATNPANNRFLTLAEKAFRDAIAEDDTNFTNYSLLADLLLEEDKQREVSAVLDQAQNVAKEPNDRAAVEVGRAKLASQQDNPELALMHYQRAAEIVPNLPQIWYNIGDVQLSLEQNAEAEHSLLKSVQLDPTTTEAYADLATLYMEQNKDNAALKILEQGLAQNPIAVDLMAETAMIYVSKGDLRKADTVLSNAELLEPESEIVMMIRQVLEAQKEQQRQQQRPASNKKSNKSKKRR